MTLLEQKCRCQDKEFLNKEFPIRFSNCARITALEVLYRYSLQLKNDRRIHAFFRVRYLKGTMPGLQASLTRKMARFTASRRLEYALPLCLYILYVYTFEKMKSVSLAAYLFLGDMEGKNVE